MCSILKGHANSATYVLIEVTQHDDFPNFLYA